MNSLPSACLRQTVRRWWVVKGFSLVEVTLAVAVTATVAMSLLGLLPAGLDGMRQSANASAHARILQTLAGQCQMTSWAEITSTGYQSRTYAFDYQGGELDSAQESEATYLARAQVKAAPPLPGSADTNARLRLINIEIVNGNHPEVFGTSKAESHTTQIAQMDDTP
ncbi:MAG TPA: Verru_Chthon cassette protein B [Verrucomicrobium sp.]|nr:Verru_Chthon cassette protein B [Verrucomicrobium sp.]